MIKDKTIQMTNLHTIGEGCSQNLASYLSQYRIFRRQLEIFIFIHKFQRFICLIL